MSSEWISVKDRLPEAGEMVLVNVEDYSPSVTVGELDGGWALVCNIGTVNDIDYDRKPTHWMPLPAPPEPKLTVREALKEAIERLDQIIEPVRRGCHSAELLEAAVEGLSSLPRLRAALESEE